MLDSPHGVAQSFILRCTRTQVSLENGSSSVDARRRQVSLAFTEAIPVDLPSRDKTKSDHARRASLKSPEELALENENLRASLDAMAVHTHEVERANKALLEQMEERQTMIRALADGVRREAYRAKQGHDLMRSQLLASQVSPSPNSSPAADIAKRLRASEQENERLQSENDKLVGVLVLPYGRS